MSVTKITRKQGVIVVPVDIFTPNFQITIGGTDVTDHAIDCDVSLATTDQVNSISLVLDNDEGRYTGDFNAMDIVKVYLDYTDASTKIFEGRLDTPAYSMTAQSGFTIEINGRGYGADALSINVTEKYSESKLIKTVFEEMIAKYLPHHSQDFSNIENIDVYYKPDWYERPLWQCFQDLMEANSNNSDFNCDFDKKWHMFTKGSRICTSEAMIYKDNMISCRIVDGDLTNYYNRYKVYGRDIEGIPQFRLVENVSQQSWTTGYGLREKNITDANLASIDQIKNKADALLDKGISMEKSGNATVIGMPNAKPGYMIWVLNHNCNIMSQLRMVTVDHHSSIRNVTTTVTFEELEKGLISFVKAREAVEQESVSVKNEFGMTDSTEVMTFLSEDYGINYKTPNEDAYLEVMEKTIVWDDNIILEAGESSGYVITKVITLDKTATECVLKVKGNNLESDEAETWMTYGVSFNNGINYETVSADKLHTIAYPGTKVKIKIIFTSLTSRIKAIGLMYK